jgi:dipeptidyl aminopeptidase/acylaminoacyl peptidase
MRQLLIGVAGACILATPTGSAQAQAAAPQATPFTAGDLLGSEALGPIQVSTDGLLWIVTRFGAWRTAPRFDLGPHTEALTSELEVIEILGDTVSRWTLRQDGAGLAAGSFSPAGRRMIVTRFDGDRYELGVLDVSSRTIRWTGVTPEADPLGRRVAWIDEETLLVSARVDGMLPDRLNLTRRVADRQAVFERLQAAGEAPAVIVSASGDEAAPPPPRGGLIRLSATTGASDVLLAGDVVDLELSPDRRRVAVVVQTETIRPRADRLAFTGDLLRRRRLHLVDLPSRVVTQLDPGLDVSAHVLNWAPDSQSLLTYGRADSLSLEDGGFYRLVGGRRLERIDLGEWKPVIDRSLQGLGVARGAWTSGGVRLLVDGPDGRVWLDPDTGATRAGSPHDRLDAHGEPALPQLNPPTPQDIGLRAALNTPVAEGWRQSDNGCLQRVGAGAMGGCFPLATNEQALAGHDQWILIRRRSPAGASELILRGPLTSTTIFSLNPGLDQRRWGEVLGVDAAQGPGRHWLLLPPGRVAAAPPAVIVLAYPGAVHRDPPAALRPGALRRHLNPHLFAEGGYVVLVPSLPLDGSGDRLADYGRRLEDALNAAAATGRIDPERAVLLGHSFGGHAALRAAAQTHRFRAIAVSNGYADLTDAITPFPAYLWTGGTRPSAAYAAWAETGQLKLGQTFSADPLAYARLSPIYQVDQMRTPLLLIQGGLDGAQASRLFSVLERMGAEAELALYPGEDHEFVSPANLIDLHARILDFFDRRLAGRPAGDPGLNGGPDEELGRARLGEHDLRLEAASHVFEAQGPDLHQSPRK